VWREETGVGREREREICEHSEMVKEAFSVPPNNNIVLHLGFE
jgi:hypothetical protein